MSLLLASASPRRRDLLLNAGVAFEVFSADIDETPLKKEAPKDLVKRLAIKKAEAALAEAKTRGLKAILASDTTVALGLTILNKPTDDKDAERMLRALSGKIHAVHTGVCVLDVRTGKAKSFVVSTKVKFRKLNRADVARYLATGEGRDKAGAYAVQGIGAALIEWLEGSYTNVIGLPLQETLQALP